MFNPCEPFQILLYSVVFVHVSGPHAAGMRGNEGNRAVDT